MVEDASAGVAVAREVVYPRAFGEVDAVAAVVTLLVGRGVLVDGGHEESIATHELILRALAEGESVGLFHEHGANHGASAHRLVSSGVEIRHQFALEFEVPAVEGHALSAQRFGILRVGTPAVHVERHGSERLPLELTHIDGDVASAEDAVGVGRDVGLSRESGSDEGGDVETDVFPLTARLVAAPDAGVALRAGPAVEGDDEGAGIVAVERHDFAHIGHTVQSETVAPAHPGHVGLEHAHAGILDLLHDVALQEGFDAVFGMEVALCPEADFHALRAGIVAKALEVGDVAVERGGLSVAGAVAVVGEEPAERHVVLDVAVDGSTGGELVVVQFAVEALADAAVVFLAFVVGLAVFKLHEALAVLGFCPVVAVVGVEMAFVKSEFGEQHRVSGELIEVVEQCRGLRIDHEEEVDVFVEVIEFHLALLCRAEVVVAGLEGVPHHAVARRRPVERCGRSHASVHPVVGVLDGDALSAMGEAAVLHTAAVEELIVFARQRQSHAFLLESRGGSGVQHLAVGAEVGHGKGFGYAVDLHLHSRCGEGVVAVGSDELHLAGRLAGLLHEDVGLGLGGGLSHSVAHGVLEISEDVGAVEVDGDFLPTFVE